MFEKNRYFLYWNYWVLVLFFKNPWFFGSFLYRSMIRGEPGTNLDSPIRFPSQTVLIYIPRLELLRGTRFSCFDRVHFVNETGCHGITGCAKPGRYWALWRSGNHSNDAIRMLKIDTLQFTSATNILIQHVIRKRIRGFHTIHVSWTARHSPTLTASPMDGILCLRPNYLLHPGDQLTISPSRFLWGP